MIIRKNKIIATEVKSNLKNAFERLLLPQLHLHNERLSVRRPAVQVEDRLLLPEMEPVHLLVQVLDVRYLRLRNQTLQDTDQQVLVRRPTKYQLEGRINHDVCIPFSDIITQRLHIQRLFNNFE